MNHFQVFVVDRRTKSGIRCLLGIRFTSLFDECIRKLINKYCFKGTDLNGGNAFIPDLSYIIKINGKEVHYFDWSYKPFYFD